MCVKPINEEFFNKNYINRPVFNPNIREWTIRFVDKGKWIERTFNNEAKALNFYFDKLRLFKYRVITKSKENTL